MEKLSVILLLAAAACAVSPGEQVTLQYVVTNLEDYEFCVEKITLRFTDHLGEVMPLSAALKQPYICICPPRNVSNCLEKAAAGTAAGFQAGYSYARTNSFVFSFLVEVNKRAESSPSLPGVPHAYEFEIVYRAIDCTSGMCIFSYPETIVAKDVLYVTDSAVTDLEGAARLRIISADSAAADAEFFVEEASKLACVSIAGARAELASAKENLAAARALLANDSKRSFELATRAEERAVEALRLAKEAAASASSAMFQLNAARAAVDYAGLLESYAGQPAGVESARESLRAAEAACTVGNGEGVSAYSGEAARVALAASAVLEPIALARLNESVKNASARVALLKQEIREKGLAIETASVEYSLYKAIGSMNSGEYANAIREIELASGEIERLNARVKASPGRTGVCPFPWLWV